MCFFSKPPELKPLPPTPSAYDEDVRKRGDALRAELAANDGTASTVKTDLVPSSLTGKKKVLLGA